MTQEARVSKVPISGLATRTACVVCVALRDFQNDLCKHLNPEECHRFCSRHGWMVANATPAVSATAIFLEAITNHDWSPSSGVGGECDVCLKVHDEKERRIAELTEQLRHAKIHSWFHDNGVLCLPHGREVMAQLPTPQGDGVQKLLERNGSEIVELLQDYLERAKGGTHTGGGVLGRAAEFLVAQRDIEA